MHTRFLKPIALAAFVLLLSACGSRVPLTQAPSQPGTTAQTNKQGTAGASDNAQSRPTTPQGGSVQTEQSAPQAEQPVAGAPNESVYFDYDSSVVQEKYNGVVSSYADFLKASGNRVRLEGNTDERGDSEYNLALGARRAEAVRRALGVLGVSDSRMDTVSYGKERPRATGQTEEAWAENRRVDFVVLP